MVRTARILPAITLACAIGFALPSTMALARVSQGDTAKDGAAAPKPGSVGSIGSVGGVIVEAPRPPSKLQDIPPDKKAALDEEAAKNEAWKRYRKSTPPFADGTLGQAKDYPGLQSLLPRQDEGAPEGPAAAR